MKKFQKINGFEQIGGFFQRKKAPMGYFKIKNSKNIRKRKNIQLNLEKNFYNGRKRLRACDNNS